MTETVLLVGCGVLRKELSLLISRNQWPVDAVFPDSALHIRPAELAAALGFALAARPGRPSLVVYGRCHPGMDRMIAEAGAVRTEGRNCIELLLGSERFVRELGAGAFFLFEDWARSWERIITMTFGTTNRDVIRDIFQGSHTRILGVRTPCSGDFTVEAEAAGRFVGLPVAWTDVSLKQLEAAVRDALDAIRELSASPRKAAS